MEFRRRLVATLRAIAPLFEEPGVMVVGSEVPNLLERDAAATLVVSQDVDVAVPVAGHGGVKRRLPQLRGLRPSNDEPSVWVPETRELLEVNFVGLDPATRDSEDTYVLEDRLDRLRERARRVHARSAVRRWEYRQRRHAKGAWGRLRRLLSEAASAWSLPEEEAQRLIAEGYGPEEVGDEFDPPRVILFIPEARLVSIAGRAPVPLRLGAELLGARCLALVRFV